MTSHVAELQETINTTTLKLVLLAIVTGGIYLLLWMYRHCANIEQITKSKIAGETFFIWAAVLCGLGSLFQTIDGDASEIGSIFMFAYSVLIIVWAFKARKALEQYAVSHKIFLKMGTLYTILFSVIYINYCINKLPEIQWQQQQISNS